MDRLDLQRLCHEGDDIGLRNGLAVSDGHGEIAVSQRTPGFWNEHVARHEEHRVQHPRVMDVASPELFIDHATAFRLPLTVAPRLLAAGAAGQRRAHAYREEHRLL